MRRIAIFLASLSILLAACSDHSSVNHSDMNMNSSTTVAIPANADYNATDVGFAQGMIPHHAQAIEMADIALQKSTYEPVLKLARAIKGAQDPEIQQMSKWLSNRGQKVPDTSMSMDHGDHSMDGMGSMMTSGMMTEADMKKLNESTGSAFDRLWLQLMIQHHEGAITMAKEELAKGKNPEMQTLAQAIISGQQKEIDEMNGLLKQ